MGFINLPEDVLLEILEHLPALTVLSCREVCRKLDKVTRQRHLWLRIFQRTQHMLRPRIAVNETETLKLEKLIGRAEMMESKWFDETALRMPIHYQTGVYGRTQFKNSGCIRPLGLAGGYMILWSSDGAFLRRYYNWVPLSDLDGPIAFKYAVSFLDSHDHYLEPGQETFYVSWAILKSSSSGTLSLRVVGIEADTVSGPHVAVDYTVPVPTNRPEAGALKMQNGLVCLAYPDGDWLEFDVLDLETRVLKHMRVSRMPHPFSPIPPELDSYKTYKFIITKTHLIQKRQKDLTIFSHSTEGRVADASKKLSQTTHAPIHGRFPVPFRWMSVIPRSDTVYAVIGIDKVADGSSEFSGLGIDMISLFIIDSEETPPSRQIYSLCLPGKVTSFELPSPPMSAQYALGILSIEESATQTSNDGRTKDSVIRYYALRVDLSHLAYGGSTLGDRDHISLNRMSLAPVDDNDDDEAEFQYFDPYAGKVVAFVHPVRDLLNYALPTRSAVLTYLPDSNLNR